MKNTEQKALDYFKSNADCTEVFATSDGFLFTKKIDAINQAKVLSADNPSVETFTNGKAGKQAENKPSIAELKALKETVVAEYTELFGEAPDKKLSAKELQKLIDAKKAEIEKGA